MLAFLGEFEHLIDKKSRVALPLRFRQPFAGRARMTWVVIPGLDPCLYVMPEDSLDEWLRLLSLGRAGWDQRGRAFQRLIGSIGSKLSLDKQGRLALNDRQMNYAGLSDRVAIVGSLDKVELWQPQRYRQHLESPEIKGLGMSDLGRTFLREGGPPPEGS